MKNTRLINFKLVICVLSGIALVYIIYPLFSILIFVEPNNLLASLIRPRIIDAFILSIGTASVSTLLIALFGIPLAYCLSRYEFPGRSVAQIIIIIPLVLPPLASGALLLGVFNPQSFLDRLFPHVEFTQSIIGIIIAQTYVASPFMILASMAAFDSIDKSLENVARVLGKRNLEVFVRVSIPLAKKGILVGIIMTWIRAIGELGATMMLAYNPHTISIQIYEDNALGGLSQAIPGIILSILLSIILIIVYSIIVKRSSGDSRKNNRIFSFGGS
ncbi:MAG TPA: ABC transporter permease [Candidatus Nitrosocosmicus sp.]|jgi:molybdate/tungstate transport system permease protein|nr:ABC transporter permease [Candidatus Nitrosocosmicus sp.]